MSASHDLDRRRQALAAGAFAFLEKAVDEEVLLEVIAAALGRAGRRAEAN
jgi:FixJ family two-component response regulator